MARHGKKIFSLMLFGLYYDDRAAFAELVQPKLDHLEGYEPVGRALAELPGVGSLFD